MRVLGLDGSPTGGARTARAIQGVLAGLPSGTEGDVISLADGPETALSNLERADAFVFGSPIYRASYAAPMKTLLDRIPRGMWGEDTAPITGRAVAIVATGASWHHFLGLDSLRNVLAGFFAAHVVPPGLYVPAEGFGSDEMLLDAYQALAGQQGRALADLTAVLSRSTTLRGLTPQA